MINEANKKIIENYPDLWERKFIESGTLLYEEGKTIRKVYYCETGIVRIFNYNKQKDIEITSGFFSNNELIIPILSYVNESSVMANIQVIEDSWMQVIDIENWKIIQKQEPIVKDILLTMAVKIATNLHNYQLDNTYDAAYRYIMFIKRCPYYRRIKGKYIASYLGIDRTTLSRIMSKTAPDYM